MIDRERERENTKLSYATTKKRTRLVKLHIKIKIWRGFFFLFEIWLLSLCVRGEEEKEQEI